MNASSESKNDVEMISAQEMKMKEILTDFMVSDPVALIYTPVFIKIPIKNCQKTLSTKAILNEKSE